MLDEKQIIELLKYGERINLECKKAEGKLPNSIWETYSSFANTSGGIIIVLRKRLKRCSGMPMTRGMMAVH